MQNNIRENIEKIRANIAEAAGSGAVLLVAATEYVLPLSFTLNLTAVRCLSVIATNATFSFLEAVFGEE